ncbi:hypothetical protein Ga0100230_005550 [Opitutaceae bacterium TAV3]|nr:hypothetical protein Ga0100230_005550 [Opitutaceae bacterium TAV3]
MSVAAKALAFVSEQIALPLIQISAQVHFRQREQLAVDEQRITHAAHASAYQCIDPARFSPASRVCFAQQSPFVI